MSAKLLLVEIYLKRYKSLYCSLLPPPYAYRSINLQITVNVRGEMRDLKCTINTMVLMGSYFCFYSTNTLSYKRNYARSVICAYWLRS